MDPAELVRGEAEARLLQAEGLRATASLLTAGASYPPYIGSHNAPFVVYVLIIKKGGPLVVSSREGSNYPGWLIVRNSMHRLAIWAQGEVGRDLYSSR